MSPAAGSNPASARPAPRLLAVAAVLCCLLAAACSTVNVAPGPAFVPVNAQLETAYPDHAWWQLRFRLRWPEGEQPDFSRHLLIADRILAPVLVRYGADIPLWRFHRRAGRDSAGHQFSLIFLADEATAQALWQAVDGDPLANWLRQQDMIEATRFNRRSPGELATLEDTSDGEWPAAIQRSWPWFIMGASQSWLLMVQELSAAQPLAGSVEYRDLLAHYRQVDAALTAQWRAHGQHAYLHHLSAIFGYQPLEVRSLRTF